MDCTTNGCKAERVGGQLYCEDHLLEQQVRVSEARAAVQKDTNQGGGTLADLIRKAKADGQIAPLITVVSGSGYQKTA